MGERYKKVQWVLGIILFINILVALVKTFFGYFIQSTSMIADGIHSFSDGASNIVGLVGIQFAKKNADEKHPYGHEKIEMLSSSIIGLLLTFLSFKIFLRGVELFRHPVTPNISKESLMVLLTTVGINFFISTWEGKKGKLWNSAILVSDAKHTKSDIYVSLGVFLSLLAMKLGMPIRIDAFMSCVISIFILHAAWEILRDNVGILLDSQVLDVEKVKEIVLENPKVKQAHKIRTRGSLAHVYIDLHILVENTMTVEEAHMLSHEIEESLQKRFDIEMQVLTHVEPYHEACPSQIKYR